MCYVYRIRFVIVWYWECVCIKYWGNLNSSANPIVEFQKAFYEREPRNDKEGEPFGDHVQAEHQQKSKHSCGK